MHNNPFSVKSPDQLRAEDVALFFVDTFSDFAKVASPENTFVHGARGTGKSMMLRGLDAPVQLMMKDGGAALRELPHFGIHVPLKARSFRVPELTMAGGSANFALGEHLLVMTIAFHLAKTLRALANHVDPTDESVVEQVFESFYRESGGSVAKPGVERGSHPGARFARLEDLCESEIRILNTFTARLPMDPRAPLEYPGAICTFADFLLPMFDRMRGLKSFPDAPIFLMLDDADNLPLSMQRVINTWISMRTTTRCCLKVTTQLGYGTYRTLDSRLIESPHDFCEVDITAVYTSSQAGYYKRVQQIVEKRLRHADIQVSPEDFFPVDEKQAVKLEEIQNRIRATWQGRRESDSSETRKGSSRVADDVTRFAVPELMRELNRGKSSATFSYAGFASMVNLSSGVIRWFLEPAAEMYAEVLGRGSVVERIPSAVQDKVIRDWSNKFLEDMVKHSVDQPASLSPDAPVHSRVTPHQSAGLQNLIQGLGELFGAKLLDPDSSERRAFSIVLRGEVRQDLAEVLALGVRQGYLQRADNASKEGSSRRHPRYILARRLGPRFYLDISGYAAHLSVTAEALTQALVDPKAFCKQRLKKVDADQVSIFAERDGVDDDQ